MKDKNKALSYIAYGLFAVLLVVIIWGITQKRGADQDAYSDGIEQIDLDTIYLKNSGVEVSFTDVILSDQNETRKLRQHRTENCVQKMSLRGKIKT